MPRPTTSTTPGDEPRAATHPLRVFDDRPHLVRHFKRIPGVSRKYFCTREDRAPLTVPAAVLRRLATRAGGAVLQ